VAARANNDYIRRLDHKNHHAFFGGGFRAMVYYLSLFFRNGEPIKPVIGCSSFNQELAMLFKSMGFQKRIAHSERAAPIFQFDLPQVSNLLRMYLG